MSSSKLQRMVLFVFLCVVATLLLSSSMIGQSIFATLNYTNGTEVPELLYDLAYSNITNSTNTTDVENTRRQYGSNSYMDHSITNPNAIVHLCHPNVSIGDRVELAYYSESGNLTRSIVNFAPSIINTTNITVNSTTYVCSEVDVDLSSKLALYPGYIRAYVTNSSGNVTAFPTLNTSLNGSYTVGITVEGPPKVYQISTVQVLSDNGTEINASESQLLLSVVNSSGYVSREGQLSPGESLSYNGTFLSGDRVYVNGISSLEIRFFDPCDVINESGYYLMNSSGQELNGTVCIVINNTDNVILNFGGEIIDGDNQTNGSLTEGTCPVEIVNSVNVSIEDLSVQQFYYGVCVRNSSATIFGDGTGYNIHGALVTNNSVATFSNINFNSNNNSEILVTNNSRAILDNVNITTARLEAEMFDTRIKSVPVPPEKPAEDLFSIDQYVEIDRTDTDGWMNLSFLYTIPLPNRVIPDNLSVFEFNGSYNYSFDNVTNTTSREWVGGNWTELFTLIDTRNLLIRAGNLSEFSVFAPFGREINETDPEPDPVPTPTPSPAPTPSVGSGGGGGGGSGSGSIFSRDTELSNLPLYTEFVQLEFEIPDNVTLAQGEIGEIPFNITNLGDVDITNITISADVPAGWDTLNYTIATLASGRLLTDNFLLSPYEKAFPKDYLIPVTVDLRYGNVTYTVQREILLVRVVPKGDLARIKVLEYPPQVTMKRNSELDVSFLVDNIGFRNLSNVSIQYEPNEYIIDVEGESAVDVGEIKQITYTFSSGSQEGTYDYGIKFYSEGELVGFVPVTFVIEPLKWTDQPVKFAFLIIIFIVWTVVTTYLVLRNMERAP